MNQSFHVLKPAKARNEPSPLLNDTVLHGGLINHSLEILISIILKHSHRLNTSSFSLRYLRIALTVLSFGTSNCRFSTCSITFLCRNLFFT